MKPDLTKKPKYSIMIRMIFKILRLFIDVPHSYVFKNHPDRSQKNGRTDYAFCENCKKFAWETSSKSRNCEK